MSEAGAERAGGARGWAKSSLVAGGVWLILAVAPTMATTLIGLPFAAYALVVGWLSLRGSNQAGDKSGARLAKWSLGLGCAGFIWQMLVYLVLGGALIATLITLFKTIPTPTPIP
jgi:hypothetical protein